MKAIGRPSQRARVAALLCLCACGAWAPGTTSPVQTQTPPASTDTGRFSEAEKAYVPAQATTRVADGPRRAKLTPIFGSKFSIPGDQVTITNPYLDLDKVFFAQAF